MAVRVAIFEGAFGRVGGGAGGGGAREGFGDGSLGGGGMVGGGGGGGHGEIKQASKQRVTVLFAQGRKAKPKPKQSKDRREWNRV